MLYDFLHLHDYQKLFINKIVELRKVGLFLGMGMGKTVISLSAIKELLNLKLASKVLIIAPRRVANNNWKQECELWNHLKDLDIQICIGDAKTRLAKLSSNSKIHIINTENVAWLVENTEWVWDTLVIDECSYFKNHASKRFKALKKHVIDKNLVNNVILLTGTPGNFLNLWSQIYFLDKGARLGKNITTYRNRYFINVGKTFPAYILKSGADNEIKSAIKDICFSKKFNNTGVTYINCFVELDKTVHSQYKKLERTFILSLNDGESSVFAKTSAIKSNKLLQLCNGSVYGDHGETIIVHGAKIKAIKEIMEENPNENFLVAYTYKSDLYRLQKEFPIAKTISPSGKEVSAWNAGEIKILLVHPMSGGHGLNLQFGGSIVIWYGLTWSLELYQQLNKRLDRQGQTKCVRIIHILTENTIENKVVNALNSKCQTQEEMLEFLKLSLN